METPDLIIPIRMDPAGATAALGKVGAAGKKAGDDVKGGADKAGKSLQGMSGGAMDAASSLLKLSMAQIGLSQLQAAATKMMDVLSDAADYARKLAADFVEIQKAMQGLAAIEGKPNQNAFVLSEIKKAEAANLTPAEFNEFRTRYKAKASMYVGAGANAKLTAKESDELEAASAEFAKGKGISAGTMADTIGGMLAQKKGKTTAKEMVADLGKVYAGLEASSTDPQELMTGMTELMAAGFTARGAAATIAQMPEIAPHQEATYLQRTTMELGQQQREGKIGAKQGLREGMDPREKLKAVTKYLHEKMQAGTTPEEKEKILQKEVGEMTGEAVAFRTLTGLARQGPEAMEQWEKLVESTPDDAVETAIEADRKSDTGKVRAAQAKRAAGATEAGGKYAGANLRRMQAEAELEKEERFNHPSAGALANDWRPKWAGGDATLREQQINARAIGNAKRELGETDMTGVGFEAGNKPVSDTILHNLDQRIKKRDDDKRKLAEAGAGEPVANVAVKRAEPGVAAERRIAEPAGAEPTEAPPRSPAAPVGDAMLKKIEENTAKAAAAAAAAQKAAANEPSRPLIDSRAGGAGARR